MNFLWFIYRLNLKHNLYTLNRPLKYSSLMGSLFGRLELLFLYLRRIE